MSSDGVQHVYATDFAGFGAVPAGTYVAIAVPEPGSLALMTIAMFAVAVTRRRRAA